MTLCCSGYLYCSSKPELWFWAGFYLLYSNGCCISSQCRYYLWSTLVILFLVTVIRMKLHRAYQQIKLKVFGDIFPSMRIGILKYAILERNFLCYFLLFKDYCLTLNIKDIFDMLLLILIFDFSIYLKSAHYHYLFILSQLHIAFCLFFILSVHWRFSRIRW